MTDKTTLDAKSEQKLIGVHPDLVKVIRVAHSLCSLDFCVVYGVRTIEQELEAIRTGHSSLKDPKDCRHVPIRYPDGHDWGRAVDLALFVNGKPEWSPIPPFVTIRNFVQQAAKQLNIPIRSGADWKSFKDWGHHELPLSARYP